MVIMVPEDMTIGLYSKLPLRSHEFSFWGLFYNNYFDLIYLKIVNIFKVVSVFPDVSGSEMAKFFLPDPDPKKELN